MRLRVKSGFSRATLRGVVAVAAISACGGTTAGTGSLDGPTSPAPKADASALQGDWELVSFHEAGGAETPVPQGLFMAGFGADEDLFIKADCNVCSAGFAARADGSLEVKGPIPCTLAYCTSAPQDARYLALLQSAESWAMDDGILELRSAKGVLVFERPGA